MSCLTLCVFLGSCSALLFVESAEGKAAATSLNLEETSSPCTVLGPKVQAGTLLLSFAGLVLHTSNEVFLQSEQIFYFRRNRKYAKGLKSLPFYTDYSFFQYNVVIHFPTL